MGRLCPSGAASSASSANALGLGEAAGGGGLAGLGGQHQPPQRRLVDLGAQVGGGDERPVGVAEATGGRSRRQRSPAGRAAALGARRARRRQSGELGGGGLPDAGVVRRRHDLGPRHQHPRERRRVVGPAGDGQCLVGELVAARARLPGELDRERAEEPGPGGRVGGRVEREGRLEEPHPLDVDSARHGLGRHRRGQGGGGRELGIPPAQGDAPGLEQRGPRLGIAGPPLGVAEGEQEPAAGLLVDGRRP